VPRKRNALPKGIKLQKGRYVPQSARGNTGLDGVPLQPRKRKRGEQSAYDMDTGTMNRSQIRGYKKNARNIVGDATVRSGASQIKRPKATAKKPSGEWGK